ncbi:MAG: hypothetical protein CM15mP49_26250 [Actinomycetota bacterium]|nr:MAG: hypothetical protein CM15mP49_26250 [Actinomycetota bacterium]
MQLDPKLHGGRVREMDSDSSLGGSWDVQELHLRRLRNVRTYRYVYITIIGPGEVSPLKKGPFYGIK